MKKMTLAAQLLTGILVLSVTTSCTKNGNLFGKMHTQGSGGTASQISDASVALRNKDFSTALNLYNQALKSDPENAEALVGSVAAELGTDGLNLGALIANILQQKGSAGTSNLSNINNVGDLIAASRETIHSSGDINDILAGINVGALEASMDTISGRIVKVLKGETNLARLPSDVSVNVNAAVIFLLAAALKAKEGGVLVITNVNGNFAVSKGPNFTTASVGTIQSIGSDLMVALRCLTGVVNALGLTNDKIIAQSRNDIAAVLDALLNPASDVALSVEYRNDLSGIGITYNDYNSYSGWLI